MPLYRKPSLGRSLGTAGRSKAVAIPPKKYPSLPPRPTFYGSQPVEAAEPAQPKLGRPVSLDGRRVQLTTSVSESTLILIDQRAVAISGSRGRVVDEAVKALKEKYDGLEARIKSGKLKKGDARYF